MALILVVDDDTSMRHFISNALNRAGHETMTSNNGLDALHLIESHPAGHFDMLLTDIVMPRMDGIALSKKAAHIDPDLKVMFMTGFSGVAMNRDDIESDAKMVSKPFHLKDLVSEINKMISG